jgi:hypothetical protein
MNSFKAWQLAQRRVERERELERQRRALEEQHERRRLELLNNPLASKVFMGLDDWRYD